MVMRRIFNKGHEKKNKEVSRTLDEVTKHRHEVNDFKRKESKLAKVATHDGSDMLPVALQILAEIKHKLPIYTTDAKINDTKDFIDSASNTLEQVRVARKSISLNPLEILAEIKHKLPIYTTDAKINDTKDFIDSASNTLEQVRVARKSISLNPLEIIKTKSQLQNDLPKQIKSGLTQLVENSNRIEITADTRDLWQEIAIWLDGIYKRVADKAKKPDGNFRLNSNGEVDTIDKEDYAFKYLTGLTKFIIADYYHQLAQSIERRINIFATELRQAQGPVTMPFPTTTNAQIALSLASTIKKENTTVTSVESSQQVLQNQTTDSTPLLEPAPLPPIPEPIHSSPVIRHAEISPPAHSTSSSPPPTVSSSELMQLHTQSLQVMHALRENEEEKKELQSVLVENLSREREETQLTYSSTPSIPPELFNRELSEGTRYTSLRSYVQKNSLSGEQKDRFSAYKEFVLNKIGSYHTAKVSSYGVPRVLKSILPEVLQPFPHDKEIEDAILKITDSDDTKDHIETIFTLWTSMVRQNSKKGKSDSGECLETACSFITGEKRP